MTVHCLVVILPYDPVSDTRRPVRLASANLREVTGLGGEHWEPAMTTPPQTSLSLFEGDFSAPAKPGGARIPINLTRARRSHDFIDGAYWPGATVEIYAGVAGSAWPWLRHFAGKITSYTRERDVLALTCEVDEEPFQAEVLTRAFAGTGGAEGATDLTGRPKPLVIGHALNVEPVLIDATNSVYQFSGYGPIEAIDSLLERGSDFGAKTGDYATYAALVAASVPAGRWATCLAQGMVKLGAPAYGVITGDVRGHAIGGVTPVLTGSVMSLLASIAGVDASLIDATSLAALDDAVPRGIDLSLQQQVRFIEIARRLALPCNHQCGIGLTGTLFAVQIALTGTPDITLHAQGRALPQVVDSKELAVSPPYSRTIMGANRSWRVHSADEIAFDAPLVPLGAYDDLATYRLGNIVKSADQSEWLYTFGTPTVGNDPPTWPTTSNTWWSNYSPPVLASGVRFAGGQTVESLKPAEPGADVTSNIPTVPETVILCDHTGAAKAGQVPRSVQFTLMRNGADVTTQATWSINLLSGTFRKVFDLTTGSLPAGLTFTRASSGTYFNVAGVMQTASTDVPRFDYDPTTHAALGLLIEVASTNLNTLSQTFDNAGWSKTNATVTADLGVAPDGTTTADRLSPTTTAGIVFRTASGAATTSYTFSVYLQSATGSPVAVQLAFNGTGANPNPKTQNLTVTTTRQRFSVTMTTSVGGTFNQVIGGFNVAWTAGGNIYAWGAQLEALAAPSSFIATAGSTATRAADALSLPIPAGITSVLFTFDDNSTQSVAVTAGTFTVNPATLNRPRVKSISYGTSPTISNGAGTEGRATIQQPLGDAVLEIGAVYGGGTATRTQQHKIKLQLDGAPATGGGGSGSAGSVEGTISGAPTSTTMIQVGTDMSVVVGSAGNVALTASGEFATDSPAASSNVSTRPYKWNGSAYVAIGTATASASFSPTLGAPAAFGNNFTDTGNTPASTQRYAYFAASGGSYNSGMSGECSAVSS